MSSVIRRTDCDALGTFSDELLRLSDLGYTHTDQQDINKLRPKEFIIRFPSHYRSQPDCVTVYYRER